MKEMVEKIIWGPNKLWKDCNQNLRTSFPWPEENDANWLIEQMLIFYTM